MLRNLHKNGEFKNQQPIPIAEPPLSNVANENAAQLDINPYRNDLWRGGTQFIFKSQHDTFSHYYNASSAIKAYEIATMADPTREETDAKIAAAEARTDTKIVRLESKMDLVLQKLDANAALIGVQVSGFRERVSEVRADVLEDSRHTRNNTWFVGLTLLVIAITVGIAVISFLPVFVDFGGHLRDLVDAAVSAVFRGSGH